MHFHKHCFKIGELGLSEVITTPVERIDVNCYLGENSIGKQTKKLPYRDIHADRLQPADFLATHLTLSSHNLRIMII